MTLRLRLVAALVALVAAGLTVFGLTTYTLYSRSQYQHLDQQIRSSQADVDRVLDLSAGFAVPPDAAPPQTVGGAPRDRAGRGARERRPWPCPLAPTPR